MFCPECRTELSEDTKYCIKCGYDFTKIKTPPERKHTSDSPDSPDTLDGSSTIHQPEIEADSFKKGSLFADRYEILSEGRKGGMGAVYKCNDTKLNKINALKVIHPKLIKSNQALSRFRQEVSISQELTHSNIVRVYNLEEWQGKEYFTMEWVEGVTLREILNKRKKQNNPFSLEEAGSIISQLSDALHYAHAHTVHRDIKPENILVPNEHTLRQIKLTDFGIAKMLSPSRFTMSSMQMGTPYYMAPEQKTDAGAVDKRADIYATGVVLFELLTLENTIGLELPSEINRELPKEIDNVIKKAVATKPEMRYGDVNDLFNELNKIVVEDKRRIEEEKKKEEELKRWEVEGKRQEGERIRREAEERKQREARERLNSRPPVFINEKDSSEMILIPAGEFLMGAEDDDGVANGEEKPQHKVFLDAYYIGKYPVTVARYRMFCRKTNHEMPGEPEWGWKDDHPIVNISWDDAVAYCKWAGCRLLTEAEWEKAARGTDRRIYPWGDDEPDSDYANYDEMVGETTLVGNCPKGASPYGVLDMAGNVWDWCSDWYEDDYYKKSPEKNPKGPSSGPFRVNRGGSWYNLPRYLRASNRGYGGAPVNWSDNLGFRLARTP